MHAYPFLVVTSVVAPNCIASLCIGGNSSSSHLFTCALSRVFLNLCHISLIYFTALLFPRGFREKTKIKGVPKWQQINFHKTSQKIPKLDTNSALYTEVLNNQ